MNNTREQPANKRPQSIEQQRQALATDLAILIRRQLRRRSVAGQSPPPEPAPTSKEVGMDPGLHTSR